MKNIEQKEITNIIFENERIRIEEIISYSIASSRDFWYDNEVDEWVSVTVGDAVLEFEDKDITLKSGDSYYIKAHERHRVKKTSQDCKWLCVYVK